MRLTPSGLARGVVHGCTVYGAKDAKFAPGDIQTGAQTNLSFATIRDPDAICGLTGQLPEILLIIQQLDRGVILGRIHYEEG